MIGSRAKAITEGMSIFSPRSLFKNRFGAFDKRKNNRGFEHESNFQEVNQQNSSTRFFFVLR